MRTQRNLLMVVALLATALFGGNAGIAAPATLANQAAPIRLKAATFSPALGQLPAVQPNLAAAESARGRPGYYLIQFRGPVQQAWKDQVAAAGVELLDYIPDYAYKVRMTPEQAQALAGTANVGWVGAFHPAYKLDTGLKRDGTHLYHVRIERGADSSAAGAAIAQSGAVVVAGEANNLVVIADTAQLDRIAGVLDVAWIENFTFHEKHNEYGGGTIMGAGIANTNGYDGSSQISAVADTGLGGGTTTTAHPDIPASRIVAVQNFPGANSALCYNVVNDGAVDVDSGHGTHVAGSVLSDGGASGEGRGVAPAAQLVFQAVENYVDFRQLCASEVDGYYLIGIPSDLHSLFQQAYNAGARIHSNSWGSAAAGDYTLDSANADDFIWDNKDMTITFSAGNEGIDANANGVIDNDSIGSPATAKNVITVGASENNRAGNYQCDTNLTYQSHDAYQPSTTCSGMGGNNILGTYGVRWPADYPANPIKDDPTAGNAEQMAGFSSRGPTDDGRIKPDVVAPGTWILSTYSGQYQEFYDPSPNPQNGAYQVDGWGMPLNGFYKYFGGTSMSNPLAGGAAAVVRDFYQKTASLNASAALVKATLINSAVDLQDENNDGADDNDFPIPNVHEGWGRINLVNATDVAAKFVDNTAGLSTGGSASYSYDAPGGAPLKVSLVWTDFASTETAAANLVNNLNLTVTGPGGVSYKGNVFSGGWSQTGGTADAVNNVENVYVQSATAGTWTVTVNGANVPNGPQPFAIVVRGAVVAPPPPAPAAPTGLTATAASSSQINLAWTDNANDETSFKIERCQGAGCSSFAQIGTAASNATSFPDTALSANTSYSYRIRASNSGGDSAYSNTASATTLSGPSNTGLLSPTANAAQTSNAGDNNGFQSNPANANANDGLFAVDTNSGSNNNTSCTNNGKDKHVYSNYSISIPGGATAINGIEVRLDARADATGGAPRMCVQLSWDGGTTWTAAKTSANLTSSEATYTLGGAADTWGRTWSSTNFSNANFRVRIINVASNSSRDFSLDWVAVRVTYQ
jgi:serine protease AprX